MWFIEMIVRLKSHIFAFNFFDISMKVDRLRSSGIWPLVYNSSISALLSIPKCRLHLIMCYCFVSVYLVSADLMVLILHVILCVVGFSPLILEGFFNVFRFIIVVYLLFIMTVYFFLDFIHSFFCPVNSFTIIYLCSFLSLQTFR